MSNQPPYAFRRALATIFLSALCVLFLPVAFSQDERPKKTRSQPPRANTGQNMTPEERKKALVERMNNQLAAFVERMDTLDDEQLDPFVKALLPFYSERMLFQLKRNAMMQSGKRDREQMMALRSKVETAQSKVNKEMKKLLSKEQLKQYRKVMAELNPPPQQGRGGGGGGRGGR